MSKKKEDDKQGLVEGIAKAVEAFLNVTEAAKFLKIKRTTIYAWVHQKRIPFRKHGSRVVFSIPELHSWSEMQAVAPMNPMTLAGIGRVTKRAKTKKSKDVKDASKVMKSPDRAQGSLFDQEK